jgi:uncharacterized membrane protein YccC
LVGVVVAGMIIALFHSLWPLAIAIVLISLLVPHGISRNYWLHSALMALLILVLYDFAGSGQHFHRALLRERVLDVFLGCALSFCGTALAFRSPSKRTTP